MQMQNVLEQVNIVWPVVKTFCGTVSRDENYRSTKDEVFTSGGVRVIAGKELRPFVNARQAAARACLKVGTRFLNGYAVSDQHLPGLMAELEALKNGFLMEKSAFLSQYSSLVQEWADKHPTASAEITQRAPTKTYIDGQTSFTIQVYKIIPQAGGEAGLEEEVNGLSAQIAHEIIQDVKDSWRPSGDFCTAAGARSILGRVLTKCQSLSFVGAHIGHVADFVQRQIEKLPLSGRLTNDEYYEVCGIMAMLSDAKRLLSGDLDRMLSVGGPKQKAQSELDMFFQQVEATPTATSIQDDPLAAFEAAAATAIPTPQIVVPSADEFMAMIA